MKILRRDYAAHGITQFRLLDSAGYALIKGYVHEWLVGVLRGQNDEYGAPSDFSKYHLWQEERNFPHSSAFVAPARFANPPKQIEDLLLGFNTGQILEQLGVSRWKPMDEGMGWLGYRIIRPGGNDGYPLSRKNWGASKDVVSFWVPIYGFGAEYSLRYVPGSHLENYETYLPENSKFTKDELRLAPGQKVHLTSQHVSPRNALVYGPDLLHTENVPNGRKTRINLEFRVIPL